MIERFLKIWLFQLPNEERRNSELTRARKLKIFIGKMKKNIPVVLYPIFLDTLIGYSMRITFTFIKNHNGKVGFSSWYILVTYLLLDFVREIEKPKLKRYPDICSIYTRQLVPHVVLQDIESESLLRCWCCKVQTM